MPNGLEPPCFQKIADALLIMVRHKVACRAAIIPFFHTLPVNAPGMFHADMMEQRELVLLAEAERLFRLLAPIEMELRAWAKIVPGTRKLDDPNFVVPMH